MGASLLKVCSLKCGGGERVGGGETDDGKRR
jgi:hypothetical protein